MTLFSNALMAEAEALIEQCRARGILIATAESCTGGLVAALLTEIPGSSDVFERGFVTYANEAKHQLLGVSNSFLQQYGAVSEPVARAMAEGALAHSGARLSIAVTGIAGPGGGSVEKPVGLVYLASACAGKNTLVEKQQFSGNRSQIRLAAVQAALRLMEKQLTASPA